MLEPDTLSTFSRVEVDRALEHNSYARVVAELTVPMMSVNELLQESARRHPLHFASVDVEGNDLALVRAWIWICTDPMYSASKVSCIFQVPTLGKNQKLVDLLESRGYQAIADTFHNTLFVDLARLEPARLPELTSRLTASSHP